MQFIVLQWPELALNQIPFVHFSSAVQIHCGAEKTITRNLPLETHLIVGNSLNASCIFQSLPHKRHVANGENSSVLVLDSHKADCRKTLNIEYRKLT